jgi:hypothetical protein
MADEAKQYTPFKMKAALYGNSPMKKNFGVGEKEVANEDGKTAQSTPGKFWGGSLLGGAANRKIKEFMDKKKAEAMQLANSAKTPEATVGAEAPEALEAGGAEGQVPQHGQESHTKGGSIGKLGGMWGNVRQKSAAAGMMMGGFNAGTPPDATSGETGLTMSSDIRLKENIVHTGVSNSGIPIYEFNYIGGIARYSGAMAQDLLIIKPEVVTIDESGYYRVNYNNIDVDMRLIN